MKHIILTLVIISFFNSSFAQNDIEINYSNDKDVLLNGQILTKDTNLETITSILGEPIIYKTYVTGKINYHYPKLGLSVHFVNENLLFIGANYNWDGDKNFPETTFTGKMKIGEVSFDVDSKSSQLSEIKVVKITCLMPELCMSNPKEEKEAIIIGFKDEKLTQIGIEFKQ
ncbi:MAG: hypothetical protein AB8B52_12050 [Winogradskyella sp.]|uniref:DUF7738 domain-containing protein n=1 Tax=Winogradskyella sp. TaxID=1883156 RepID=UPI00385B2658